MRDLLRLRWVLPFLFPPAGVVAAIVLGDVVGTLVVAGAFVAAHIFTIPDRTGRRLSLSPMVAVAALLLADNPGARDPGSCHRHADRDGGCAHRSGVPGASTTCSRRNRLPWRSRSVLLQSSITFLTGGGTPASDFEHAVAIGCAALAWYVTAALVRSIATASDAGPRPGCCGGKRSETAPPTWRCSPGERCSGSPGTPCPGGPSRLPCCRTDSVTCP